MKKAGNVNFDVLSIYFQDDDLSCIRHNEFNISETVPAAADPAGYEQGDGSRWQGGVSVHLPHR